MISSIREPQEPSYSCLDLDDAIGAIERARAIHDDLRAWGNWWKKFAEDLQDEVETLQKEIAILEKLT